MEIANNLNQLFKSGVDQPVDVILVCDYSDKTKNKLNKTPEFIITDDANAMVGFIYGRIKPEDVKKLNKIPGLISIELDEEQTGFEEDLI